MVRSCIRESFAALLLVVACSSGCSSDRPDAQPSVCGDGYLANTEECDDGNVDNTDGCLSTCVVSSCGDGYVYIGVEECDDGNVDNTDGCLNTCVVSSCGDGYVYIGVEECDGNIPENGDCTDQCTITCNEGFGNCNELPDDGCESNLNTASRNCGSCGNNCQGGECQSGVCHPVILASDQNHPFEITVDATGVYWTNRGTRPDYNDGTVMKVPLGGGSPTVLASGQSVPTDIVVNVTGVYWTNRVFDNGTVMSVHTSGDNLTTLASGQSSPTGIAADATSVCWTNEGDGTVMKILLESGIPTIFASGQRSPTAIALDMTSVYWTNVGNTTVMKAPLQGGDPTTLAMVGGGSSISVDGTHVYWGIQFDIEGGAIYKVAVDGGSVMILATGAMVCPSRIAVDDLHVYWTYDRGVMMVPLDGGSPVTLVSGQNGARGIAVDSTSVYWTNYDDGTVMKMAK